MKIIKENNDSFIFLGGINDNLPITQMNRIELSNLRNQIDSFLEQSDNNKYEATSKSCPTCGGKGEILGFPKNGLCPTCNGSA